MTAIESNNQNFFSTTLAASITAASTSIQLDSIGTLTSPAYLVIDPNSDTKREVIYADGTWTGTTVVMPTTAGRGLAGSASGAQAHDSGTLVVSVPLAQHVEDIHDRVDANVTELATMLKTDGSRSFTGAAKHTDGTEGAPSITFDSDPDTGMYTDAADVGKLAAGGSRAMLWDDKSIGINLGTEDEPGLRFVGDSNTGIYSSAGGAINFTANGTPIIQFGQAHVFMESGVQLRADAGTKELPGLTFRADGNTGLYWISSGVVGLSSNGTQRVQVGPTGIDVTGTATADQFLAGSPTSASAPAFRPSTDADTGMYADAGSVIKWSIAGTESMRLNSASLQVEALTVTTGGIVVDSGNVVATTGDLKTTAGEVVDQNGRDMGRAIGYTPVLSGSTTNPTRQNGTGGTIEGAYAVNRQLVSAWIHIEYGSTGTAGSGNLYLDLPLNANTGSAAYVSSSTVGRGSCIGTWHCRRYDSILTTTVTEHGSVQLRNNSSVWLLRGDYDHSGTYLDSANMFTDNDVLTVQLNYMIAA